MRQCPFCKAAIEDNARFCLYCMTPLNQKEVIPPWKRNVLRWPFAVVGVLLVALVALLLLPGKEPTQSQVPSAHATSAALATTAATTEMTAEPTTAPTQASTEEPTEMPTTEPTATRTTRPKPVVVPTAEPTTAPTTKPTVEPTTAPTTTPTTAPTAAPTDPPTTGTVNPYFFPRAKWEEPETGIVYEYRVAVQADVMGVDYQVAANDVVITGVEPPDNWVTYKIPAYIDGKYRVIALAETSFWEFEHRVCNIDTVYLPATVVALDKGALWASGLNDLYISGEVLAKGHGAYVKTGTVIHCSRTCQDQNGERYSDSEYWEEWDGSL